MILVFALQSLSISNPSGFNLSVSFLKKSENISSIGLSFFMAVKK